MRASPTFAFVILLAITLPPSAAHAAVQVIPDPRSRSQPERYWVIRSETADEYDGRPRGLLLSKFSRLAYGPWPISRPAPLRRGNYYIYPVCPGIGTWPEGRSPARSSDRSVMIKCP
jgi:hypothetical protein